MVMVVVMMVVGMEHSWIHIIASCSSLIEHDQVSVTSYVHSTVHVDYLIFVHSLM